MAKLSPETKAANKVVAKERAGAFSARRKAYGSAMKAAEEAGALLPEHAVKVHANEAFELSLVQRDDAVRAIDEEIAKLRARRAAVIEELSVEVVAKKALRTASFDADRAAKKVLTDAVDAAYPDMVDVYTPAQWQRPTGV